MLVLASVPAVPKNYENYLTDKICTTLEVEKVLLIVHYMDGTDYIVVDKGSVAHSTIKVISGTGLNKLPSSFEAMSRTKLPIFDQRISEVHEVTILDYH